MKHSEEGKWTVSTYDEIFNSGIYFETKEQAIEGGKKEFTWEGECPTFYVGQVKSVDFALGVNAEWVLENISSNVYDEVGEVAEDYLYHVEKEYLEELEAEMNKVIQQWMKKFSYNPSFFKVINIEKVTA